jgi:hypothetical protein
MILFLLEKNYYLILMDSEIISDSDDKDKDIFYYE